MARNEQRMATKLETESFPHIPSLYASSKNGNETTRAYGNETVLIRPSVA